MLMMRQSRHKGILAAIFFILLIIGGFFLLNAYIYEQKQADAFADYKDAAYMIDGARVQLTDGSAESEAAPGSASKILTRYFGNELKTDLNGDGREDVVFLLTQERGGSGAFFYAVAALNTERGYIGSDGYLLGDRIAPQTTEVSQNPRQKYVVVVNYADRAQGEPMTARPSMGKSAYLKLDTASMQWGVVEPNFEGESDFNFGVYGYRCGDGTEFTMSPTSDMSRILITPATSVERIRETVLYHVQSASGARYEGSGLTFLAHGEKVQLSSSAFTTTCTPMQVPDEAPFNFGD